MSYREYVLADADSTECAGPGYLRSYAGAVASLVRVSQPVVPEPERNAGDRHIKATDNAKRWNLVLLLTVLLVSSLLQPVQSLLPAAASGCWIHSFVRLIHFRIAISIEFFDNTLIHSFLFLRESKCIVHFDCLFMSCMQ